MWKQPKIWYRNYRPWRERSCVRSCIIICEIVEIVGQTAPDWKPTHPGWWFQPLWKIWVRQLGLSFPTEWKVIKFMFQTTNQQYFWFRFSVFAIAIGTKFCNHWDIQKTMEHHHANFKWVNQRTHQQSPCSSSLSVRNYQKVSNTNISHNILIAIMNISWIPSGNIIGI